MHSSYKTKLAGNEEELPTISAKAKLISNIETKEITNIIPKATTIRVSAKVSDLGDYQLFDQNNNLMCEQSGYVPDIIPGRWGDYIEIHIDLSTGRIINWTPPTDKEIQDFIDSSKDSDSDSDSDSDADSNSNSNSNSDN